MGPLRRDAAIKQRHCSIVTRNTFQHSAVPWVEFINETSELVIMQLASQRNMFVAIVKWSLIASRMAARDMVT